MVVLVGLLLTFVIWVLFYFNLFCWLFTVYYAVLFCRVCVDGGLVFDFANCWGLYLPVGLLVLLEGFVRISLFVCRGLILIVLWCFGFFLVGLGCCFIC